MNPADEDYLTPCPTGAPCVWCHDDIPAGQPAELVVERDDKQWWSCAGCAAETRAVPDEPTAEEKSA